MSNSNTVNGTTYTTHEIYIKNTQYHVMVVEGKYNYINVKKITANPNGLTGKDFENFNEAINHYKNPQMKVELLKIEMQLN